MPIGINGGDEKCYLRFFERFEARPLALDAPEVQWGEGFHGVEIEDGAASHCWLSRRGSLEIPRRPGAKFIRLTIWALSPDGKFNSGVCRVNGGRPHPFDNTCEHIHFPIDDTHGDRLRLDFEMDEALHVPGDNRDLGLSVRGLDFLFS